MTGPDRSVPPAEQRRPDALPGHFVSDEHRSDCARFLDEVRSLIDRREAARGERARERRRG